MCGIVDLEKLITTVKSSGNKWTNSITKKMPIFIYVKNWCPFSKRACECLKGQDDMTILDMVNKGFVKYKKGEFEECESPVPEVLITSFKYKTVPQVFCFCGKQWHYIGGCEDVLKLEQTDSKLQSPIPTLKM
jgi:glutaredoxin